MEENRAAARVVPADECIVVHADHIGNINDISLGGLYCTCIQESVCVKGDHREIDILCGQGKFLVQGVKVQVVSMERFAGRFLKELEVKRCRMQFLDLAEEQSFGIETIVTGACVQ